MKNLIFLLLFIPFSVFSQIKISGKISDEKQALEFATIVLAQNNKTIAYTTSSDNGKYTITINAPGTYTFKVSYLAHKKITKKIKIIRDTVLNFKLNSNDKVMDEVTIKSHALDAKVRKDTVTFNLKNLKGNEKNLKDVIKELPGLGINDNGKITANGKVVDNLLINGNNFFGHQHQLATENISSNMVKNIKLLNNYTDISELKGTNNTGKTALSVDIKDRYRGKFKGNISSGAAYQNKYLAHANLYNFGDKSNFFLIGDANNIAKQAFTILDYLQFSGILENLMENPNESMSPDLPQSLLEFLVNKKNIKSRASQFGGLNYSTNISKKLRINFLSIVNRSLQEKNQDITQTYFNTDSKLIWTEAVNEKDSSLMSSNSIDITYKPSSKTILRYNAGYAPFDSKNFKNSLSKNSLSDSLSTLQEYSSDRGYSFNHRFDYTQKLGGKSKLKTSLYQSKKENFNQLSISSHKQFLDISPTNNSYSVFQKTNKNDLKYGVKSRYTNKFSKMISLELNYGFSHLYSKFHSYIDQNNPNYFNEQQIIRNENKVGFSLFRKDHHFFNYNMGFDYAMINSLSDHQYKEELLPKASITLNFKAQHRLMIAYSKTLEFPNINNIIPNKFISDYLNIKGNKQIAASTLSKYQSLDFQYYIYDAFSGIYFFLMGNYKKGYDIKATQSVNYINYNLSNYILSPENSAYSSNFRFKKKFFKVPFALSLKGNYHLSNYTNYIGVPTSNINIENKINSEYLSGKIKISSLLKNSFINFDLGITSKENNISYSVGNEEYKVLKYSPFFNISGVYKNFKMNMTSSFESYKSTNYNVFNRVFNAQLVYQKPETHWEFSIVADNFLNLNKNLRVESSTQDNYIVEKEFSAFPGYILLSVKFL